MKIIDYSEKYSKLVTFSPNKETPIHNWYPLIEGYSKDFVEDIINEQKNKPKHCIDPFGGVGTTALTCLQNEINCTSIEASPFFYDVAHSKLNFNNFNSEDLEYILKLITSTLINKKGYVKHPKLESKTFFNTGERDKWIFHKSVSNALFDIVDEINSLCVGKYLIYKKLLIISLANILQEVSNVFKNGKCLSYKTGWKEKKIKRKKVHSLFLEQVRDTILKDLKQHQLKVNASANYILGDSRVVTETLNEKFDLMVTSPPYLNSRDYTDIYRLELWILGYINKFKSERVLRKRALTSHVQIQLPKVEYPKNIKELEDAINHIEDDSIESWNKNIPNMVRGYFKDMETLLSNLMANFNSGAKLYINVSNSSYFHFVIEVDIIIAKIAEQLGYRCTEIRIARLIKTSNQQKKFINSEKMRESVIVLEWLGK